MKKHLIIAVALFGLAAAPVASRAEDDGKLINYAGAKSWSVIGSQQTNKIIKDKDVQGGLALEVTVLAAGQNPWDVATQNKITGRIAKGDAIVVAALMKAGKGEPGAAGKVILRLQLNDAPYTALVQDTFTLSDKWEQYEMKTVATETFEVGSANIGSQLASAKQVIDLGPVYVINMGPAKP